MSVKKSLVTEETNNIWSTYKVDNLVEEINRTGVIPRDNPFFMRKIDKRKADLVWEYTMDEVKDIAICTSSVLRFAGKCKVMTKKGRARIKLRPYQIVALKKLTTNNFFLYLASRQIGKSIIIGIFMAWIVTFFPDKSCLLGSENLLKAKDLKSKIDEMIHGLPFYMQNGLTYYSTQRSIYDNGSKIVSEPTTENFGVSGSYNVVYMDEFALLEDEMQEKIIKHVVPTLDSFGDEARLIISTTPRGKNNKFYKLWNDSLDKKNKFGNFMTKWYEVDGRDDKWREEQIAIMGEEGFNQEYNLSFQSDSKLLFNTKAQKLLDKSIVDYTSYDELSSNILRTKIYPNQEDNIKIKTLSIRPKVYEIDEELENLSDLFGNDNNDDNEYPSGVIKLRSDIDLSYFKKKSKQFVVSIDLAGGVGADYSVCNIFEIEPLSLEEIMKLNMVSDESDFFRFRQIGLISCNILDVEDYAKLCYAFFSEYTRYSNFRIVLENNYEGGIFMKTMFEINGNDNVLDPSEMMIDFPWDMIFEDALTYKTGIKQTDKTKSIGVKSLLRLFSKDRILMNEKDTIMEAQGFGKNKKGKYAGTTRNDDKVMTVVNVSHYFQSDYFIDQIEEIFDYMDEEHTQAIDIILEKGDSMEDYLDD